MESAHLISLKIAPHLNNVFLKINRISFDILIISNKMTCKKKSNAFSFTWRLIKEFHKELVTFRCPVQGPTRHGIFEWMTNQRSVFRIYFSDWSSIKKLLRLVALYLTLTSLNSKVAVWSQSWFEFPTFLEQSM